MKKPTLSALSVAACLMLAAATPSSPAMAASTQRALSYSAAAADMGSAPADTVVDLSLTLNLVDRAGLEAFVASTVDPSSRNYRRFLTPAQFAARYGQSDAVVARVRGYLESQGLTVTQVFGNKLVLTARATNSQASAVFNTPIHSFVENGVTTQRPLLSPAIPAAIADVVNTVSGLSTRPAYHTHTKLAVPDVAVPMAAASRSSRAAPQATLPTPGSPQRYTVVDLARLYNINPLYARGISGTGTTLGIMTFASFTTTDVGTYWTAVGPTGTTGLTGDTTRISVVNAVPGSTIGTSGADETTLDVEQSGGVAPGAKIIVYEAPNTDAGAVALYAKAITDNLADTLSISWGLSEAFYANPTDLAPYDTLFLQAAAQGVPISASSGDEGAYDLNYSANLPYPNYSAVLSVDYPSSSPYVVAAGGTTLPVSLSSGGVPIVSITAEQPWAYDYLRTFLVGKYGQAYYYANYFPAGGGGGVSMQYPLPSYQAGLPGVQVTAPGQALVCFTSPTAASGAITCNQGLTDSSILPAGGLLPTGYAGRNTPDVSLNADPDSGYTVFYAGQYYTGFGGTSFVAPQLNGIFALLTQSLGHRVGWPHPQLYNLFRSKGYATGSPFRAITTGSNLFWPAGPNFNPATGLGSLDVNNLATALSPAAN